MKKNEKECKKCSKKCFSKKKNQKCLKNVEKILFGRFAHCRHSYHAGVDLQHSFTAMFAVIRTLPCCGCACSATRLFGCPPVSVFTHPCSTVTSGWTAHLVFALRVSRRVSLACARGRGWATHGLLTEVSTGVPWVSCRDPTRVLPMPRQYGHRSQSAKLVLCWSVCVWCAYTVCGFCRQYVFCTVFSHTPPRHGPWTCGPVDLEKHFAPLVAHHSLTRLIFIWLHLTASACTADWNRVSEALDLYLNSLLALAAGFCSSPALTAVTATGALHLQTSCNHSVHTFRWWHMVHLIVQTVDRSHLILQHNLCFLHVFGFQSWERVSSTVHCCIRESSWFTRSSRFVCTSPSLHGFWTAWPIKFSNSFVSMRSVFHTKFSCPLNSRPEQLVATHMTSQNSGSAFVWNSRLVASGWFHPVYFLNWCNTSPDWLHCCFWSSSLMACHTTWCTWTAPWDSHSWPSSNDLPWCFLEHFHHHVFAWSLRSTYSAFQDLLRSFRSAVQPFFAAEDPAAVFIHHDVLHLSFFQTVQLALPDVCYWILENLLEVIKTVPLPSSLPHSLDLPMSIFQSLHSRDWIDFCSRWLAGCELLTWKYVAFQILTASPSPPGWNPCDFGVSTLLNSSRRCLSTPCSWKSDASTIACRNLTMALHGRTCSLFSWHSMTPNLENCLALGTHRHHRSSETSGIVCSPSTCRRESSSNMWRYLINLTRQFWTFFCLRFFSSLLNLLTYLLSNSQLMGVSRGLSVVSTMYSHELHHNHCYLRNHSFSLAANSDVVFFKSTVSAAIFTFSTWPSLLCSEPFQLFSNLTRNSLHKSRSLNTIQRRQPEKQSRTRAIHTGFSCRSSLSISPQTPLKYSRMSIFLAPLGLFSWLRKLSANTCSTGSSIALLGHQLDRLDVLVTRAGDCNKTDTVTVILMYSSRSSSHPCMRSWRLAIRHTWTLVLELEVWHGFQRAWHVTRRWQPALSSLSSALIVRHSARHHLKHCIDQWCCCSSWSMSRWSTWFATISSSLTGTGLLRKTVHTLQQRFSCSTPPRSDFWTVLRSPKSCFLRSDEETVPTFTSSTAHWLSNSDWSTLDNLTSRLSFSISDIPSKTLTDEVHKHLMDLTQHCIAGLHPPALS